MKLKHKYKRKRMNRGSVYLDIEDSGWFLLPSPPQPITSHRLLLPSIFHTLLSFLFSLHNWKNLLWSPDWGPFSTPSQGYQKAMWISLKHSSGQIPSLLQNLLFSLSSRGNTIVVHHTSPTTIRFYSVPLILPTSAPHGIVWRLWHFNPSFNNWRERIYIKSTFQASLENGKLACPGHTFPHDSSCWSDIAAVPWRIGDSYYICMTILSAPLIAHTSLTPGGI